MQHFRTTALLAAAAALVALLPVSPAEAGDAKAIVMKSDCMGCHAIGAAEAKKMGPNFAAVGAKYKAGDAAMLAGVIKKGGSGHWGALPMPPHPQLSDADTKAIATWILGMKGGAKPTKPKKP